MDGIDRFNKVGNGMEVHVPWMCRDGHANGPKIIKLCNFSHPRKVACPTFATVLLCRNAKPMAVAHSGVCAYQLAIPYYKGCPILPRMADWHLPKHAQPPRTDFSQGVKDKLVTGFC